VALTIMDRHQWSEPLEVRSLGRLLVLERGAMIGVPEGRGTLVTVIRGSVWLTQARDSRDILLHAGERFLLDRKGLALVQAPCGAELGLDAPAGAAGRIGNLRQGVPEGRRRHALPRKLTATMLQLYRFNPRPRKPIAYL
jgi:Protein of unknown function (DUF2917)